MKSPITYCGGKTVIARKIADAFPAHGHYVEPFAGSLSVLLAKEPSRMETVNDLDGDVVNFWRVLRERPAELARACALTPHSRVEYDEAADLASGDELERARRLWVRLAQSRTGRLVRAGWRHYVDPGATGVAFPAYLDGYVDRIAAAAERLHHVSLECRPALDVIAKYGAHANVLLYVDPPYLGSTRASSRIYRHELMSPEEHRQLAEVAKACAAAVVISGYPSPLYDDDLFADWSRMEMKTGTGQGSNGWSNRTEVLWSNRPFPEPSADLLDIFTTEAS